MMLKRSLTWAAAVGLILASSVFALAQTHQAGSVSSGYALVNGLKLYYEIHGTGEPLILLHGGLGSTEMFTETMPVLSRGRRAIAVDLQAHGRTGDIERPLSFDAMADDIAALMKYLNIEKADVMGYSIGGGVAPSSCSAAERKTGAGTGRGCQLPGWRFCQGLLITISSLPQSWRRR